ncbi:MAG: HAD family hydrolase [Verrucomicrobia bacterium]|nr:HAD family hydrolase [Cytophagales bacterium]
MNKAIFLDRDGVLNEELGHYVFSLEEFKIVPKVPEALQLLKSKGFFLIVVTNQAGIARGVYSHELVQACHDLLQQSCHNLIDAFYYSPFHPDCDTESLLRKPDSLMLEKGAARFDIDLCQSWMVGDKLRDMEAGKKAGTRNVFIDLTEFREKNGAGEVLADFVASNLWEAGTWIVSQS